MPQPDRYTNGLEVYLVGGAVRDELLGREVKERDWVVVGSTAQAMLDRGFRQVGKDFPVFLHPSTHEEYALARTERKTAAGYHGFDIHAAPDVTLKEDLLRRDLTVNALARGSDGNVVDYYGGLEDLENRRLRHVSPAFAEDPVRILRIARFSARYDSYGFRVAEDTNILMQDMVKSGEADALVAERVWQELAKTLGEERPWVFFEVLRACSALARVFPEIDRLFGVPQTETHHPEIDTGIHTMMVLEQACKLSDRIEVRYAALVHDLGKGTTPADILPRHIGHEERSAKLARSLGERLRVPSQLRDLGILTAQYHTHIHRAAELRPDTVVKVLENCDVFRKPERFEDLTVACEADSKGRLGFENRPYPQAAAFRQWADIARKVDVRPATQSGLKGPEIKAAIRKLRIAAIRDAKLLTTDNS